VRTSIAIQGLSQEQRELWDRVDELWAQSRSRDRALIGSALHPQYVGWDMSTELPHDKDSAIESVTGDTPVLQRYSLFPHSVQVYEHKVGVVHYSYRATVEPRVGMPLDVTGKWTEVYLKQGDQWTMVAVSGRPDASLEHEPQNVEGGA